MALMYSYSATIVSIEDIRLDARDIFGGNILFTVQDNDNNIINFVVTLSTYFINYSK